MEDEVEQKKLRRFVDLWTEEVSAKLRDFQGVHSVTSFLPLESVASDINIVPVLLNPINSRDRTSLLSLVETNNVLFSKIITLISYNCIEIERLHKQTGVCDLSWFLSIQPFRLASKYIHIKSRVQIYLNETFYNHAAMAIHNWKAYCEMKHLAEQKYGLILDEIHLPSHVLVQGMDVLDIVRNIHTFVSCYTYNLNTQVFIEKPANAHERKYLNTVSVKHVATSIQTHGEGIMSTAVKYAYRFLAQNFMVLSQFLFDEKIESRLAKETGFWKIHQV